MLSFYSPIFHLPPSCHVMSSHLISLAPSFGFNRGGAQQQSTKPDPGPFYNHSLSSPTLAVASTKRSPAKTLNFLDKSYPKVDLLCADLVFDDLNRRLSLTSHAAWFAEGLPLPVGACGEQVPPPLQDLKQQRAMIQVSIKRAAPRRRPAWH